MVPLWVAKQLPGSAHHVVATVVPMTVLTPVGAPGYGFWVGGFFREADNPTLVVHGDHA